ncbi:hypothetical protein FBEOM_5830 [Fusarium beomiforme]|uniref:Uncharacterized protein n=1 Tax=Fusarium beomiforme TaxID=44412 RepID=A0A9P5DYL6_9HYPO|nr:hypothetical protein FBEOM_5830 [Fusarium beomiforme]
MQQPTAVERAQIIQTVFDENQAAHANTPKFDAYFRLYCSVVCPSSIGNAVLELNTPVLRNHSDVLKCLRILVHNPNISFNDFISTVTESGSTEVTLTEKKYIVRVTTHVLLGINCTIQDYGSNANAGSEFQQANWRNDTTFHAFIETVLGLAGSAVETPEPEQKSRDIVLHKKALKAWKLHQRYGIEIKATDNLLEHLLLDTRTMTLKVFHQVSFLRAHLEKTRHEPLNLGLEECLKRGTLPPKLLLETLLTFHDVLFPIASVNDTKSLHTLKAMIKKQGFDPEGRWIEFVRDIPPDMSYTYWGHRLAKLHDFVKRPPPANAIVAWFERHTSERNALTVAIIGVFLSVIFGFLSFLVGLLQLILAWKVYNNPPVAP